jgi:hypothetical protein
MPSGLSLQAVAAVFTSFAFGIGVSWRSMMKSTGKQHAKK